MKKLLLALAALFVVGLATFYLLPSSSKPADANVVFQDASGKKLTEKDFNGKPTVYYAWASWCPDCQQELPILNTLKEKYADKVEFVGVAMISQKEPIENGKKYLKEHSLSLNYYSDVDSSFQKYHEITEIPTLIFVDKDGKIVKKTAGVLTQEELENYIKEILLNQKTLAEFSASVFRSNNKREDVASSLIYFLLCLETPIRLIALLKAIFARSTSL